MMFFRSGAVLCLLLAYGEASMTNSWAVEIRTGGKEAADALASEHGFVNLGQVGNLKNIYHFIMPVASFDVKKSITGYPVSTHYTRLLEAEHNVGYVQQQERRKKAKKEGYVVPTDPNWNDQWSLLNTGQLDPSDAGNDLNAERAWLQGLTGCETVVAVVDDGIEYTHSDLSTNYVSSIQYDFLRRTEDPFPISNDEGVREDHGTSVAGEIAMEKGNGVCGVGVAYNSFITALRLVSTPGSTDMDDAEALSWQDGIIDIYSNSWGPVDNGHEVSGPETLLQMALKTSTQNGREGKGSIYTFAAGNGGPNDTCAADGYTNSIYTISVGSASSNGRQSSFDEECSGKMVVTFDTDPYADTRHVTTTTVQNGCIGDFSGTSASTPLVSGVLSLLLEASPDLTWRDVQYLIVHTANINSLVDGEWVTNGAGLRVSHKFGFGAIDAEAIVTRGRHWINVPSQLNQEAVPFSGTRVIESRQAVTQTFTVSSSIVSLEHVVLVFNQNFVGVTEEEYNAYYYDNTYEGYAYSDVSISWGQRGYIVVELTSPSGTTSTLLPRRTGDIFPGSYVDWPFMSLHFWGEDPTGTWTVVVRFMDSTGSIEIQIPRVTFYGTSVVPEAVSRIPQQCSPECDSTRGCAAIGAEFCDACAQLRIASSLECTSSCPEGLTERNGYCYDATLPDRACDAVKPSSAVAMQPVHLCIVFIMMLLASLNV